jgi:hypothetical protein
MKNRRTINIGPFSLSLTPNLISHLEKYSIQFASGHREILFNYIGLETSNILTGVLQHGVSQIGLTPDMPFRRDNKAPRVMLFERAPIWVYSEDTKKHLVSHGIKKVEAISAPWNYLPHTNFKPESSNRISGQEKYIVFPAHFNIATRTILSKEEVQSKIAYWRVISQGNELTVCLYWSEFVSPVWQQVCKEEGVNLVTAGIGYTTPAWSLNIARVEFLHNLSRIMQCHTHCIFERDTSGVFYAISLGLSIGYFPATFPNISVEDMYYHEILLNKFPEILEQFVDAEKLADRCDTWLGRNSIRTPDELRAILKFEACHLEN